MPITCATCREQLSDLLDDELSSKGRLASAAPPVMAAPASRAPASPAPAPPGAAAAPIMTGSLDAVHGIQSEAPRLSRAELEAHVASCPDCTRDLQMLRALRADLSALPALPAPASLRAGVRARLSEVVAETAPSITVPSLQKKPIETAKLPATEKRPAKPSYGAALLDFFRRPSSMAWASGVALAACGVFLLMRPQSGSLMMDARNAPMASSDSAANTAGGAPSSSAASGAGTAAKTRGAQPGPGAPGAGAAKSSGAGKPLPGKSPGAAPAAGGKSSAPNAGALNAGASGAAAPNAAAPSEPPIMSGPADGSALPSNTSPVLPPPDADQAPDAGRVYSAPSATSSEPLPAATPSQGPLMAARPASKDTRNKASARQRLAAAGGAAGAHSRSGDMGKPAGSVTSVRLARLELLPEEAAPTAPSMAASSAATSDETPARGAADSAASGATSTNAGEAPHSNGQADGATSGQSSGAMMAMPPSTHHNARIMRAAPANGNASQHNDSDTSSQDAAPGNGVTRGGTGGGTGGADSPSSRPAPMMRAGAGTHMKMASPYSAQSADSTSTPTGSSPTGSGTTSTSGQGAGETRRARLVVTPPRDVAQAAVRLELPSGLQLSGNSGRNAVAWRGVTRSGQSVIIPLSLIVAAPGPHSLEVVLLDAANGNVVSRQTIMVNIPAR